MGKFININQVELKIKTPANIAQRIHIITQGLDNIICFNGKGSLSFSLK